MHACMAVSMDQQPSFKFFCRICKKGFGCGRALGGHMRAHGIGDEGVHVDDDDQGSDWEEKLSGGTSPQAAANKRMYALRANPHRLKSCRVCENCGKEFASWKAFLEHGRCGSDEAESLVSSPTSEESGSRGGAGWFKRKRSRRMVRTSEEEDLAHCLVMLSAARVDPPVADTEESCASAGKAEEQHRAAAGGSPAGEKAKAVGAGLFECKACKKVFSSHQALGGHRASHKKVKGCFAAKLDDADESLVEEDVVTHDELLSRPDPASAAALDPHSHPSPAKRKSKVHECSICHRTFASGQALGGHKRCHWVTANSQADATTAAKLHPLPNHSPHPQLPQRPMFNLPKHGPIDLNLPAPVDDVPAARPDADASPIGPAPYLQQWIGPHSSSNHHHHHLPHRNLNNNSIIIINNNNKNNNFNPHIDTDHQNNNYKSMMAHVDDEADSNIKLAKLSDLKDMNMAGGSSPWLQVGIGSTTTGRRDP